MNSKIIKSKQINNGVVKLFEIKQKIKNALDKLYDKDKFLFAPFGNKNKSLCERCINHRFAMYLEQQHFGKGYFVDCEYNKSHFKKTTNTKRVSNIHGNYIDIIITKRDGKHLNDLVCLEIKKCNNYRDRCKDRENLKILTGGVGYMNNGSFGYDYGFYIIFGKTKEKIKIEIYQKGEICGQGKYNLLNQNKLNY
ncbi:hypothetical protein KAJ61_04450 [Candidatus Parcubacteria bacterium]|nr:hypothetical protein [Candidatus Parcubacteria bacterium]